MGHRLSQISRKRWIWSRRAYRCEQTGRSRSAASPSPNSLGRQNCHQFAPEQSCGQALCSGAPKPCGCQCTQGCQGQEPCQDGDLWGRSRATHAVAPTCLHTGTGLSLLCGQGSMLPRGLLLHPNPTAMLERPLVMDEVEGCILLASLLALCCPRIPLQLLDGSWRGP